MTRSCDVAFLYKETLSKERGTDKQSECRWIQYACPHIVPEGWTEAKQPVQDIHWTSPKTQPNAFTHAHVHTHTHTRWWRCSLNFGCYTAPHTLNTAYYFEKIMKPYALCNNTDFKQYMLHSCHMFNDFLFICKQSPNMLHMQILSVKILSTFVY